MEIYVIPNKVDPRIVYICDSQATIDSRPKNKQGEYIISASLCSVGTQVNADSLLAANQQTWLTQQTSLFTVNLQTIVEGGVIWTVIDLNAEPENTDRDYFLLDPTDGLYEPAVGLQSAKALFAQIQQEYLVFTNMSSYQTWTEWPQPVPPIN